MNCCQNCYAVRWKRVGISVTFEKLEEKCTDFLKLSSTSIFQSQLNIFINSYTVINKQLESATKVDRFEICLMDTISRRQNGNRRGKKTGFEFTFFTGRNLRRSRR
ncbi:hypothetical protein Tsp_05448 [Trichinella spiralis]|uniref:hypothetical protein n=1 Tax=Trichinella spiralis TaxID=6334 RepID=UPI0001EFD771|nr:hypothetical protein Tsp_05448 [Trichinella spiralis]